MKKYLTELEWWDKEWQNIFDSYQKDTRVSYYINSLLEGNEKVLEIAAGSFRDTNHLNNFGVDVYGCDFSNSSVQMAKEKFLNLSDRIEIMDAFNLNYGDKFFDVTYHNGFWVCFKDNEQIKKLLYEQIRVTKKMVCAIVHNKHNKNFIEYFNKKVEQGNKLFDVRFFDFEELLEIFNGHFKSVEIIPVGKSDKSFEDSLIMDFKQKNEIYCDKELIKKTLLDNKKTNLEISERLLIIGYL